MIWPYCCMIQVPLHVCAVCVLCVLYVLYVYIYVCTVHRRRNTLYFGGGALTL